MSAECHKCGLDIVYPKGTWPIGECPSCDHEAAIALRLAITEWLTTDYTENHLAEPTQDEIDRAVDAWLKEAREAKRARHERTHG